ncbi:AtpZ/AtpI family protein [Stakelama tenebrarum]|uniref:AtpZ/AtpI family protein n=1 Tax=Stakelama tenebrarum TaxID=2711215 RepID=A0A6G6Y2C2_9SPHN|nr:AtpZ/AtpI family protein [Sphingosinithalassobacter tenebrarum]QIG78868.1 AtpZ/AtpI family protein [Sphingosinithalassobacter tenebrarum]
MTDRDSAPPDRLADAAHVARRRAERGARTPEPSLAARLAQIGVLGWMIVLPALAGVAIGRLVDRRFDSGIMMTAALLLLGVSIGFWSAWRWMHRS